MLNKVLVAFDFDHTIIEDNSDLSVRKLAPDGKLPQYIKDMYKDNDWTGYMAAIFQVCRCMYFLSNYKAGWYIKMFSVLRYQE